ncbi:activator of Hsp90 ATPase [Catenaria anguillulae PL171]|uniref:Activator of Hsp90 ATPase n=1 Tax=Catenaria anguillulae PL171 TaxID=765915 RepID=A0A1Y2HNG2_9FUNG|nr:activator of Hsp90 ATPase [Catenaria anguillulae PL171]
MTQQQAPLVEDKNWKNVGNWHWVTKDSFPFAKDYFTRHLEAIAFENDGVAIKGKLITIYDLTLTINWTAKGPGDLKSRGTVVIPEISHDLLDDDDDDLVLNVTVTADSRDKDPVRAVLRKHLRPHVLKVLRQFPKDLVASQSEGVFIEGAVPSAHLPKADLEERKKLAEQMDTSLSFAETFSVEQRMGGSANKAKVNGAATAAAADAGSIAAPTPKPVASTTSKTASSVAASKKSASTGDIIRNFELRCNVTDAHACFTELDRMRHWTQGQCDVTSDAKWSIFGQVTAQLASASTSSEVVLDKWRLSAWPADVDTKVTLKFTQEDDGTKVKLLHVHVPLDQKAQVDNHWSQVFNRIKMTFGYGSFL